MSKKKIFRNHDDNKCLRRDDHSKASMSLNISSITALRSTNQQHTNVVRMFSVRSAVCGCTLNGGHVRGRCSSPRYGMMNVSDVCCCLCVCCAVLAFDVCRSALRSCCCWLSTRALSSETTQRDGALSARKHIASCLQCQHWQQGQQEAWMPTYFSMQPHSILRFWWCWATQIGCVPIAPAASSQSSWPGDRRSYRELRRQMDTRKTYFSVNYPWIIKRTCA